VVILLEDQASKENFATTVGGFRLATSARRSALGRPSRGRADAGEDIAQIGRTHALAMLSDETREAEPPMPIAAVTSDLKHRHRCSTGRPA